MEQIRRISSYTSNKFRVKELDITYPLNWGSDGIEARLESIKAAAVDAVKSGVNILIVTDKNVSAIGLRFLRFLPYPPYICA